MSLDCVDVVAVYTGADTTRAIGIEEALNAEGICCFLEGLCHPGLTALELEVRVPAGEADRARGLIREQERRG
jgi:hypothetical protein